MKPGREVGRARDPSRTPGPQGPLPMRSGRPDGWDRSMGHTLQATGRGTIHLLNTYCVPGTEGFAEVGTETKQNPCTKGTHSLQGGANRDRRKLLE